MVVGIVQQYRFRYMDFPRSTMNTRVLYYILVYLLLGPRALRINHIISGARATRLATAPRRAALAVTDGTYSAVEAT